MTPADRERFSFSGNTGLHLAETTLSTQWVSRVVGSTPYKAGKGAGLSLAKSQPKIELHTPFKQVFWQYLRRQSLDDASQEVSGMTVKYRDFTRVIPQKR